MKEMYFIAIKILRIKIYTMHVQKRNVVIAYFKNSSLFFSKKKIHKVTKILEVSH